MNNLIRSWNGRTIRQREDGYFSATDMCQSCNKRFFNWERLDSTQEYLKAFQDKRYSDVSNGKIVEVIQGGLPELQGTWVHRRVAIRLAQWLSPEFALQVDEWTEELLLKGYVSLDEQVRSPKLLPSAFERAQTVNQLFENLRWMGYDIENPRTKQHLHDSVGNILWFASEPLALPGTGERWLGVVERAEELGFKKSLVQKYCSPLGRHVRKFDLESTQEKRLFNGRMTDLFIYKVDDRLDAAIKSYFAEKLNLVI